MQTLTHDAVLSLLDHAPLPILLLDDGGRVQGCNRAFAELVGDAASNLEGSSAADGLLAPLLGDSTLVNWIMPDGDERWLSVERHALADAPGITACFYQDVTEKLRLKQQRDALQQEVNNLALNDAQIPSLLSHYGLQITLEPLVSRSRRYNSPLSLLCIGIDTAGDRNKAITRVSYLLNDQTRWADLVGCNNAHDFILILQETTQDAALQLVDKLAPHIQLLGGTDEADGIRASFGVTQCQRNDDAAAMLERVQAALVEARNNDTGTAIAV